MRKSMIKNLSAICLLMVGTVFTACNDWLDVDSDTKVERSALFDNEAGYADAISGIYAKMTDNSLYGKNLTWYMIELMGGGAMSYYAATTQLTKFQMHPKAPGYSQVLQNSTTDQVWSKLYNTIANVNSILASIDEDKDIFMGSDYNVMKGECLGIRAFLHFEVLRLFADAYTSDNYQPLNTYIPYVTALSSNVYPLLTNDQACTLMLEDLAAAKELLKSDPMYTGEDPTEYVCSAVTGQSSALSSAGVKSWHNRRFHFNYYAALATEARIHLWMGNTSRALECAKEVIGAQSSVFPWVKSTFVSNVANGTDSWMSRDRTFATEQIFSLNVLDMEDRLDGYQYEVSTMLSNSNNTFGFNPEFFEEETRQYDIRFTYLKNVMSIEGRDVYLPIKYLYDYDPNNYSTWSAHRIPLIRLSEMYYIAAECEPDLSAACEYLNAVRNHRGLVSSPISVTTKEELQEQIRLEYHKEMISEGQTFYYYKRKNQNIVNKDLYTKQYIIAPNLFTFPRPDNEDTYGGR